MNEDTCIALQTYDEHIPVTLCVLDNKADSIDIQRHSALFI